MIKRFLDWFLDRDRRIVHLVTLELAPMTVTHTHIFKTPKPPKGRVGFGFTIGLATAKKEKRMPLEISITNEQQIPVTLNPKTDTNKPAPLDGVPKWEVISGDSTVVVADDGKSATLVSADDPGDTQILVKADANLGEGVEEISDTIKLTVLGAAATNLGLAAGTAVAKPGV